LPYWKVIFFLIQRLYIGTLLIIEGNWVNGKLRGRVNLRNYADGSLITKFDFLEGDRLIEEEVISSPKRTISPTRLSVTSMPAWQRFGLKAPPLSPTRLEKEGLGNSKAGPNPNAEKLLGMLA
jgi:hypothetical protein